MERYKALTLQIIFSLIRELINEIFSDKVANSLNLESLEFMLNENKFKDFLSKEFVEKGRFQEKVYNLLWNIIKGNSKLFQQELGDIERRIKETIQDELSKGCLIYDILNSQRILQIIFDKCCDLLGDFLFRYKRKIDLNNQLSVFERFLLDLFKDKVEKMGNLITYLNSYEFRCLLYYVRLLFRVFFFEEVFIKILIQVILNSQIKSIFAFRLHAEWLEDIMRKLNGLIAKDQERILLIIMRNLEQELPSRLIGVVKKYYPEMSDDHCIWIIFSSMHKAISYNREVRKDLMERLKEVIFDIVQSYNEKSEKLIHKKALKRIREDAYPYLEKSIENKHLRRLLIDLLSEIVIIIVKIWKEIRALKLESDIKFSTLYQEILKKLILNFHMVELLLAYLLERSGAIVLYNAYIIPFTIKEENNEIRLLRDKDLEAKLGEIDLIIYIPERMSLKIVELTTTTKENYIKKKFSKFRELMEIIKDLRENTFSLKPFLSEFSTGLWYINFIMEDKSHIIVEISKENCILDLSNGRFRRNVFCIMYSFFLENL